MKAKDYFMVVLNGEKVEESIRKSLVKEGIIADQKYVTDLFFNNRVILVSASKPYDMYDIKFERSPFGKYVLLTDTKKNGVSVKWNNTNAETKNIGVCEELLNCYIACEKHKETLEWSEGVL